MRFKFRKGCQAGASLRASAAPELRGSELAVGEERGRDDGPAVQGHRHPLRAALDPHARPADVDAVLVLRRRAPARHEHGDVHGGQRKDEVEERVVVGHRGELVQRGAARAHGGALARGAVRLHLARRDRQAVQARAGGGQPLLAEQRGALLARGAAALTVLAALEREQRRVGAGPEGRVHDRGQREQHARRQRGARAGGQALRQPVARVVLGLAAQRGERQVGRVQADDGRGEDGALLGQRVQRHRGRHQQQQQRHGNERDVEAAAARARGVEPVVHEADERERRGVRAARDRGQRVVPALVLLRVAHPRLVPHPHKVQQDDHLYDQEEARPHARHVAVRVDQAVGEQEGQRGEEQPHAQLERVVAVVQIPVPLVTLVLHAH
mmetsp:Transcript_17311/g.43459  ORF Transcript_17311/g.43459 Transcript_17311/m.43459 type:complete len:383 (-) Transcript_17311:361-1509(-)